jgi:hypothetical protein
MAANTWIIGKAAKVCQTAVWLGTMGYGWFMTE